MSEVTEWRERAQKAVNRPAPLGEDIDLTQFSRDTAEHPYLEDPTRLPAETKRNMLEAGVTVDDLRQRAGTFLQIDRSVVHTSTLLEGVEVMDSQEALAKYDWLADYWWRAVAVDADKYTAEAELHPSHGYFIRALPGAKVEFPVQACLYLNLQNITQNLHNIIIAEEGSELHVITGCTTPYLWGRGLHIGISEFYIKKGAKLTFTMIHNWAPEVAVRPRTGAIIEEDGVFIGNYICMRPVRTLQMYPTARCVGKNAVAEYNSVLVARPDSNLDVGSRVILSAPGARAEIVARALTTGGVVVSRGHMVGEAPDVKGHLECRGLILADTGSILAIPELEGKVAGVDLSHEAAVGKIAEEELEYLMARGLTRDEATSTIVKGFVSVPVAGLPPFLAEQIRQAIQSADMAAL